jgi:hypothetical protein
MDNPESLAALGTQDEDKQSNNNNNNKNKHNMCWTPLNKLVTSSYVLSWKIKISVLNGTFNNILITYVSFSLL